MSILEKINSKLSGLLAPDPSNQLAKVSYSQSGEDLIVAFIFEALGIEDPTYIDIGAHHPQYLSNTAIFYERGSRGINIEPDPVLFNAFTARRALDTNLQIGVGPTAGKLDFYVMSTPTLNTFSKQEAERYQEKEGYRIEKVLSIPVLTVSEVLTRYFKKTWPDFLSLDIEGLDLVVLQSLDLRETGPLVICVESITFSSKRNGAKLPEMIKLLENQGYLLYADTHINSIFVRRDRWVEP